MRYSLAASDSQLDDLGTLDPTAAFGALVGTSTALRDAIGSAVRLARRASSTVLLVGEAGTGKEFFARAIHAAGYDSTSSVDAPFVPIDCSTLPTRVLEAELFGRASGAFTGGGQSRKGLLELARNGALFLGAVGEMPQDLQPRLLRALEERIVRRVGSSEEMVVHCKLIAATTVPLEQAVSEGRFRDDLFQRLAPVQVVVPPLRERAGDIPLLAEHFLQEMSDGKGLAAPRLSPEALKAMEGYAWPGNVRELKNALETAARLSDGGAILARHLHIGRRRDGRGGGPPAAGHVSIPLEGRSLASVEAETLRMTLELTGWNRSAAARILQISRPTLARKIEGYRLTPAANGEGGA